MTPWTLHPLAPSQPLKSTSLPWGRRPHGTLSYLSPACFSLLLSPDTPECCGPATVTSREGLHGPGSVPAGALNVLFPAPGTSFLLLPEQQTSSSFSLGYVALPKECFPCQLAVCSHRNEGLPDPVFACFLVYRSSPPLACELWEVRDLCRRAHCYIFWIQPRIRSW